LSVPINPPHSHSRAQNAAGDSVANV
jgi:hypothetical protein